MVGRAGRADSTRLDLYPPVRRVHLYACFSVATACTMTIAIQDKVLRIVRDGGRVQTRRRTDDAVVMAVDGDPVAVQPRPFCLGDEDPVGGECALALFIQCCLDSGHSPVRHLRRALDGSVNGDRITQAWKQAVGGVAGFEDVEIPARWDGDAVDGLLYSLFEGGYADLVTYVDREIGRDLEIGDRTRLYVARARSYERLLRGWALNRS